MDIKNPTQFANFVGANGLTGLDNSFLEAVICMNHYAAACDCHKRADKATIYETCQRIYQNAVRNVVPKHKGIFLSKAGATQISFYADNGSLIGIISR